MSSSPGPCFKNAWLPCPWLGLAGQSDSGIYLFPGTAYLSLRLVSVVLTLNKLGHILIPVTFPQKNKTKHQPGLLSQSYTHSAGNFFFPRKGAPWPTAAAVPRNAEQINILPLSCHCVVQLFRSCRKVIDNLDTNPGHLHPWLAICSLNFWKAYGPGPEFGWEG